MRKMLTQNRNVEYFVFFLVAYGVNFLFGIPLMFREYINVQVFVGLMVLLPATAVFSIEVLYKEEKNESKLLRKVMFGLCLFYFIIIFSKTVGIMSDKATYVLTSIATNVSSILFLVFRRHGKESPSIFNHIDSIRTPIFLLIFILVVKNIVNALPSVTVVFNTFFSNFFFTVFSVLVFFPLFAVNYFGEEYGWRGYLQEKIQDKFGKRLGVVLIGIMWEFWHMPLWFTQYELTMWEILFRFLIAISLSIFLGYIFMRTRNVWLCALVHCIYNTLTVTAAPQIQGEMSAVRLIAQLLVIIVMSLFLFKKEYGADIRLAEK